MELSALDEARFGVRTAIARSVAAAEVDELLDRCRSEEVELLVARCRASDLPAAQALERAGALLMDTLVYFAVSLDRPIPDDGAGTTIRLVRRDSDAPAVGSVAAEAFKGYVGHYHADPRLAPDACDATYVSWAERSVLDPTVADEVVVGELDGRIVGFATVRQSSPEEAEILLNAVAPAAQGRGVYRSLLVRAMRWAADIGAERLVVSTQLVNIAPQKAWVRLGFEPAHAVYTFHRWFT
jgi:GNAT superfamily N-acetyltransferase